MIYAVLVLYKKRLEQSRTFISLTRFGNSFIKSQLHLLIYENSANDKLRYGPKQSHVTGYGFASCERIFSEQNDGIAAPYNIAYLKAKKLECRWLLLLDQDSEFGEDFARSVLASAETLDSKDVAAVVPKIMVGSKVLAPRIGFLGTVLTNEGELQIQGRYVTTVNSGSLISIEFLGEIGGFDEKYWLDGLDTWLFMRIFKMNRAIIISPTILRHNLSLASNDGMTVDRMIGIVRSECQLWRDFANFGFRSRIALGIVKRSLRLIIRAKWTHLKSIITVLTMEIFAKVE